MSRGRSANAAPRPEWMSKVVKGSLIRSRSGKVVRIVRHVNRHANGDLDSVYVVKQKCSWTSRPFTILSYNDLIQQGYTLVEGVKAKLDRIVDMQLEKSRHAPYAKNCLIHDWDVVRLKLI